MNGKYLSQAVKITGFSKFGRRVGYCGSKSAQQTAQRL